ncbi:MAG: hypothetical protein P4L41_11690 [Flavipsychrobacter sp.]|nr:hypothetical protein [Flavipsychrobacter sp.]
MKNVVWILLAASFTIAACNHDDKVSLINDQAALPATFKFDTLGLKVMASFANKKYGTMSVLYANGEGISNAIKGDKKHSAGEVRALVTWGQQDDPSWFGARIPGSLKSVELVKISTNTTGLITAYAKYSGKNLLAAPDTLGQEARIKYILDQQPSIMP